MDTIFGLPAHPLLVHIPIVLVPLLALVTLAMVPSPRIRGRIAPAAAVIGVGLAVITLMTSSAGEGLRRALPDNALIERHADLGDQMKVIVLVYALLLVIVALFERRSRRLADGSGTPNANVAVALATLAAVAGIIGTVWTVRTGHAGAKAVWWGTGERMRERGLLPTARSMAKLSDGRVAQLTACEPVQEGMCQQYVGARLSIGVNPGT